MEKWTEANEAAIKAREREVLATEDLKLPIEKDNSMRCKVITADAVLTNKNNVEKHQLVSRITPGKSLETWDFFEEDGGEEEEEQAKELYIAIPELDPYAKLDHVDTKKV